MSAPLIVITGTSASGKTTILQEILKRGLVRATRFVTCTTRPPRPDEHDGVSYWFMTKEDFAKRLAQGEFFEHATVYGQQYGSSRLKMEAQLAQDTPILIVLDVQGSEAVRRLYPQTKVIFIDASDDMLKARLLARNLEPADLAQRLKNIEVERKFKESADVTVESSDGHLEEAISAVTEAVRRLSGTPSPIPQAVA